ncbi:MAG: hypothetical protein U0R50_16660 [Gaiellales bacterium]
MNEPMVQLRTVLQDEGVRQRVLGAKDEAEMLRHLNAAGKTIGTKFTKDWLRDVVVDVKLTRWPPVLTEQELLLLASQSLVGDTAPKLCHTDSCGGHPTSCC